MTQPIEGWRHDYTEQWGDSSLMKIAAFANTFGGVLVVGVKKGQKDVTCEVSGVESDSEYKTRIASSIAANISPVPSYEVFECHRPDASNKRLCVVRVRESTSIHLITKKGISQPVYVRNEDQAVPADAPQLRRLIEREKRTPVDLGETSRRATDLLVAMSVKQAYREKDSPTWYMSTADYSQTGLKLVMIPSERMSAELERSDENKLRDLVHGSYRRVLDTIRRDVASQAEIRGARFYDYVWNHKGLDYESRWRVLSTGELAFGTQVRASPVGNEKPGWSVVDVADYIILFVELCMRWWEYIGYFGDGYLHAQLNVTGLTLMRSPTPSYYYIAAFDPRFRPIPSEMRPSIRSDAIQVSHSQVDAADAEVKVAYFTGSDKLPWLTTSLLNQLLRSLGHAVLWDNLQSSIGSLVSD